MIKYLGNLKLALSSSLLSQHPEQLGLQVGPPGQVQVFLKCA